MSGVGRTGADRPRSLPLAVRAVRLATQRWGETALVTIILAPPMIDQFLTAVHPSTPSGDRLASFGVGAVLAGLLALSLALVARRQFRRLSALVATSTLQVTDEEQLQGVRCIVALRGTRSGPGTAEHVLPRLRDVERVVLVGSPESVGDVWKGGWADVHEGLRERVRVVGDTEIDDMVRIEPFGAPEASKAALDSLLAGEVARFGRAGVVADVTQGTALMSLALHGAAERAGVRSLYSATRASETKAGSRVFTHQGFVVWSPASEEGI
ncbi:hypothetical protein [Cellulomonas bogoriensis]|uniref:Uncharacterized protein n=1 Tax=Cellulomonas bogoriensis 69B4 = DSM 16987 TaxID=1386082 RepID=A0A0A0C0E5_9CELL|nr:hypothetical protein [Cellulomonas bogoriensis]KGM12884.1 hypothetical protein N869_01010 [Cellulomonas bogoriensis 69B4 = DSM 16987]